MIRAAAAATLALAAGAGCDLYIDAGDSAPGGGPAPTTCEAPSSADTASVCGTLLEIDRCEDCAVTLAVYDLVEFLAHPEEAPTLAARMGTSGPRFFLVDLPPATVSSYMIVAEPSRGTSSATAVYAPPGSRIAGAELPIASDALIAAWRAAGVTDADALGAVLVRYRAGGDPVAGVTAIAREADVAWHYLGDDLATVAPENTTTGASGAAVAVGAPLRVYSGDGALAPECWWPDRYAGAEPGLVVSVAVDARCP